MRSVETLAHEMGHSIHTLISDQHQIHPLNHYPIILAEIASTLNEHLLFDHLYLIAKSDQEKINLLQTRISTVIGTFFRQIQFAEFEYEAHRQVEQNKPVSTDIFAELFQKINNKYQGSVLTSTPNTNGKYT